MSSNNDPLSFINGRILLNLSMLQDWLEVVNILLPLTANALNDQLVEVKAEINTVLATSPQANIVAGKLVTPISLVADFKYALATVEYQLNGDVPKYNLYADVTDECDSVYNCYSISYQAGPIGKLVIY